MQHASGNLFKDVSEEAVIGKGEAIQTAALQVVDAVARCHGLSIYRGELVPGNILGLVGVALAGSTPYPRILI